VEELDGFLTKMQTLDDVVTDFTPPTYDRYVRDYERRFRHVPL